MLNFNIGTMQSDDWPAIRNIYSESGHLSGESFEHRVAQVLRILPSRITGKTRATRQYLEDVLLLDAEARVWVFKMMSTSYDTGEACFSFEGTQ
jgi:hypothetical protein